ncbi:hypothetical protein HaLaN_20372 [Haematococcus lacustris]|uniref:Uncharacterized protein n=1 Tax=Haematococcus lacustris TaxID=44745 RepID=A0A699ZNX7_HAELA|nr:hypothetical protein HaLaN_20372 [Haematococcus lacustris]
MDMHKPSTLALNLEPSLPWNTKRGPLQNDCGIDTGTTAAVGSTFSLVFQVFDSGPPQHAALAVAVPL